jgi:hypothetical protein
VNHKTYNGDPRLTCRKIWFDVRWTREFSAETSPNRETPTDKLGNFDSFFAASTFFLAHLTFPAHSQLDIPRIIPLDLQNENETENQHDTREAKER